MRFISLLMQDFMNHRKSEICFSSIRSALIVGKTKENDAVSNGVGKSTIFAAIEWAIFNKVHKMTLDTVVREGAKKAIVEFCFEIGGSIFKIHRSLTAKGTKNIYFYEKIDGEWEKISQRTPSETEEKILKTVSITHKAFQTFLFRQADLSGLVVGEDGKEASSKKRTEILKEPLNLMRYSKKEKMVSDLAKPIKKDIEAKQVEVDAIGDPEKDIKASKIELDSTLEKIVEKEELIKTDLQVSLEEKQLNLQKLKSTLSSSDADIHDKVEEQHLKVKRLNRDIESLGSNLESAQRDVKTRIPLLKKKKEDLVALKEKLSEKEAEEHRDVKKIQADHKKVCDDELKGSKLQTRAEVEYEHAKKSIPDSDNCPSCQQSISAEYRAKFEEDAKKVLDEKQSDIDFYKKQLGKCRTVKNKLAKELEAAKQHISDVASLKDQVDSVKDSIKSYKDNIEHAETMSKETAKQLDTKSTELQEAIKHYDDLKDLASKSGDLTELNNKIFSIAREIKVYEQSIDSMRIEIQNLKTREGVLKERIKNRNDDLKKLDVINADLIELRTKLAIHQHVINSFSHKGIPTLIINTCLNELQLETNKTLQELRPDLEVQFDADLNFTYRRNGQERDYHQLSHGQHVYIALAFKRGLAHVVQKKMGCDIRCILFDEVDSALDKAGVEALANAIKKWQDDFLVLVITHNDSLKDKFSHAILVEEGDDGSEAKVVTSW